VKIENIDVEATIEKARQLVEEDKNLSAATKSMFEIMVLIITLLANRLNLNSTNSSKPPSSDPNRKKKPNKKTGNKPGAQKGHVGTTLKKVDDPDKIEVIKVDRSKLPAGQYRHVCFEARQVFDIDISRVVTEYRAEVIEDANGKQFVADFPGNVTKAVQYGAGIKAHSVYMSQYQLIPYNRIQDYFADQLQIPLSEGSIFNFNMEAFRLLADFEVKAKAELAASDQAHADETGINVGGKRHWLHCVSNDTLRFMENALVPFSNNLGENDIRMTKVQQKISGCFSSMDGAKIFCLVRSYLSSCRKQGIKSSHALELLFSGRLPEFS